MAESSTRTADRALELLAHICENAPTSLSDSARATDLAASTALRLLRTLEKTGFVSRDSSGDFRPGSRIIQLGVQALSHDNLVALCHQPMEDLAEATGESVYLSVLGHNHTALYIAITEGTHSVRHTSWVGRTIPLESTAAGAVLVGEIPANGFVTVGKGVEDDVTAIAAPVRSGNRVVASMSLLVPSYRLPETDQARFGRMLVESTQTLSDQLSGISPVEVIRP